jgi:hypothetical protein
MRRRQRQKLDLESGKRGAAAVRRKKMTSDF